MIICTQEEAYFKGYKKFMAQRKFGKVYVLPCKIGRKEFASIWTESDIKKAKLNATCHAVMVFGDTPKEVDSWNNWRNDPTLQKAREMFRYSRATRTMNSLIQKWRCVDGSKE